MQTQGTIISLLKPTLINEEQNKDKISKNSINLPNKENQVSSTINQIKENEIESSKTQLTVLPPSNNSCKDLLGKKTNVKELKIEMFLCKKRKHSFNTENNNKENKDKKSEENNELGILKEKNSNIEKNNKGNIITFLDYKSNKVKKNIAMHFKMNKKNKFEFKNNNKKHKTKTIYDYYKSTSIKTNKIYNKEKLCKKIEEQDELNEIKNKEISMLKLTQRKNEELIASLREQQTIYDEEINKCRLDISNMLKEISKLKRENKVRWFNEQEYNLGKLIIIHKPEFNKSKNIEYWKEGKKIYDTKIKLKQNQCQIDLIQKNDDNNSLSSFTLDCLLKEKEELCETLKKLETDKYLYLYKQNLFNQEKICTFSPLKKEGLPFLNERYQILELIGKGGYSEVYKAYDTYDHKFIACKLIQLNENWPQEIKQSYIKHTIRENLILQNLNHKKIVKLYDTLEINDNAFCNILEYCSGPDLSLYIRKNGGSISEQIAKIIITQILQALIYLNNLTKKIIHYDLKPENILFDNDMNIKITDFGLAKIIEPNTEFVQLTSQGVGTYWYLPPECFEENKNIEINSKVDIWSLGVILYEIIFNKKPFGHGCSSQKKLVKDKIIQNAYSVEFPENPEISEKCKDFIQNCLKYKQSERYDAFQAFNSEFIQDNL
jgi:tousled-like kinase